MYAILIFPTMFRVFFYFLLVLGFKLYLHFISTNFYSFIKLYLVPNSSLYCFLSHGLHHFRFIYTIITSSSIINAYNYVVNYWRRVDGSGVDFIINS